MIASTSFDHRDSEMATIEEVVSDTELKIHPPVKNEHFAGQETFGASNNVDVRAEVGILTRNVVIKGDDNTEETEYGGHLKI